MLHRHKDIMIHQHLISIFKKYQLFDRRRVISFSNSSKLISPSPSISDSYIILCHILSSTTIGGNWVSDGFPNYTSYICPITALSSSAEIRPELSRSNIWKAILSFYFVITFALFIVPTDHSVYSIVPLPSMSILFQMVSTSFCS